MAQFRPNAPIVAIATNKKTCNALSMIWGVIPIYTKNFDTMQKTYKMVNNILIKQNLINTDENFLIASGILKIQNSTNMLQIYKSK